MAVLNVAWSEAIDCSIRAIAAESDWTWPVLQSNGRGHEKRILLLVSQKAGLFQAVDSVLCRTLRCRCSSICETGKPQET